MIAVRSQWSVIAKSVFGFALCAVVLARCASADAQQQGKAVRVGEIVFRSRPDFGPGRTAFRQQLRELGYVDGKNIAFESRSAEGKLDRFRILADELVRLKVDVLFASSTNEARAFKNATTTIPIVFHVSTDPVADELVDSLARPGGNITGVTTITTVLPFGFLSTIAQSFRLVDPTSPRRGREGDGDRLIIGRADIELRMSADRISDVPMQAIEWSNVFPLCA